MGRPKSKAAYKGAGRLRNTETNQNCYLHTKVWLQWTGWRISSCLGQQHPGHQSASLFRKGAKRTKFMHSTVPVPVVDRARQHPPPQSTRFIPTPTVHMMILVELFLVVCPNLVEEEKSYMRKMLRPVLIQYWSLTKGGRGDYKLMIYCTLYSVH